MSDYTRALVGPQDTLRDAIAAIDAAGTQIALVVAPGRRLLGVLTDGDVRRALIRGTDLATPVERLMNRSPVTVSAGLPATEALAILTARGIHQLPVLGPDGTVTGLLDLRDVLAEVGKRNT